MASKNIKVLQKRLEEFGHTNVRVWWEPLGPAVEMCGPSGGYFFESDQDFSPIGLSFKEVMQYMDEYPGVFRRAAQQGRGGAGEVA